MSGPVLHVGVTMVSETWIDSPGPHVAYVLLVKADNSNDYKLGQMQNQRMSEYLCAKITGWPDT